MDPPPVTGARRELTSRNQPWARQLSRRIAATGLTPNGISLLSLAPAAGAAWALVLATDPGTSRPAAAVCFLLAAAGIQCRLLGNLLDGMVAIECGKQSATGGLYNEAPDRLADVMLLVAAGQSAGTLWGTQLPLGWLAAVLAVGTAYLRVLGGTLTGTQNFMGPMAKQHRMFVLTMASLGGAVITFAGSGRGALANGLWPVTLHLIVAGSLLTCLRRLREIARLLKAEVAPRT